MDPYYSFRLYHMYENVQIFSSKRATTELYLQFSLIWRHNVWYSYFLHGKIVTFFNNIEYKDFEGYLIAGLWGL